MSVLRPLLSACLMLPLWSGAVLAEQSSAEPVKQTEVKAEGPCAVFFAEPTSLLDDAEITYRADGCTLTNVTFNAGMYQSWTAKKVEIRSAAINANTDTLPEWGEVHIQSVGYWPSNLPAMRYLNKIKDDGFNLKVAYSWDKDSKILDVSELRLNGKNIGDVLLSASVELPELPKFDVLDTSVPSVEDIKLRQFSAKLDDQGFFVNYVMMSLIGLIGYQEDPEPEVEKYRSMALAFVSGLSADMLGSDDKQAIIRFITDLPKPKTPAEIQLNFDPAFTLVSNEEPLKVLGDLQKTLKIKAAYAGQ